MATGVWVGYKRLPHEFCDDGAWPRGPFRSPAPRPGDGTGPASEAADTGLIAAAANLGRLVVALGNRRKTHGWSRARLARQSGVGQHTIGRIEAGRTWPDLVTVARLTHALGMSLTMAEAGAAGAGPGAGEDPSVGGSPVGAPWPSNSGPLRLGSAGVTAAQAIDLLFAHDPRLAAEVSALAQSRRRAAYASAQAKAPHPVPTAVVGRGVGRGR